jgi:hypothetical protein
MKKFFNTTGPCFPERHYMLPPADRLQGADLKRYLQHELYWVLHAPRQTGKTTFLLSWMREINTQSEAIACYVSLEMAQGLTKPEEAMQLICESIQASAASNGVVVPEVPEGSPYRMLNEMMQSWAALCAPKPLVVLFDEVDVLEGQTMVSFLRQLRSGFADRGVGRFPTSIALVGMRDLRDYLTQSKDGKPVNPGSPFNIKHASSVISNFTLEDIRDLIAQHTEATGQAFSEEAVERIWYWTNGQPWLVNSICLRCAWEIVPEETKETVEACHVEQAKEWLVQSRATHLDSLSERLKDARIRRVMEVVLLGEFDPSLAQSRGFELCLDLGLVILEKGNPVIANRIYREVIPRSLSYGMQVAIPSPEWKWKQANGTLDLEALLGEFQKFWRRHSEIWEGSTEYKEAFPHLLLMAFLQRVVNGGGQIEREYAAGRGRVDLMVDFGGERSLIEIKLVHPQDGRETTLEEGLLQVERYGDQLGAKQRALVIFDRRPAWRQKAWEERLASETIKTATGEVRVVWC